MPRHRRFYSNSARFADLRVVCLSIEYKPVLVVVYYWIGIRIGVGPTGIGIDNMFGGGWTIRIEPFY
jgi:hypothetical protein